MSTHSDSLKVEPLDLSRWRDVPTILIFTGLVGAVLGLVLNVNQFAHSWLVAFMFFLSLGLGGMFLVLVHHLFDAGWSVPIRRFCEHLACLLFPWLAIFFVPIALLAPRLYGWMNVADPHTDHALHAKLPLFTKPAWYLVAALCFAAWWFFSSRLRHWSLEQDKTGAAECTFRMRRLAAIGVFVFAVTLTFAAIMWMKGMMHQWFSTMYGVYYFAGSAWLTLATVYLITMVLKRNGTLAAVLHEHQFYFLGSLLFAFTVFYAYIHFSQYFIIWNANMPEETFWYVIREQGSWFYVGLVLIFGHFFLPFLALLRIDLKLTFWWMVPICVWAWLMHYVDMAFNIKPSISPGGYPWMWAWLDLSCLALIGGVLARVFLKSFASHPPFPIKDPRLIEAMGHRHPVASPISGGEMDETDELADVGAEAGGGAR
ncbi:MAG: hypothetical protein IPM17_10415 [Verrucomicrobia bacterium]|nr:hypothetical protein [Verrucomicrobiota bacterium]